MKSTTFPQNPDESFTIDTEDPEPVVRIIEAVARLKGVDVTDLPPIGTQIDPDALNKVCQSAVGEWSVSFEYEGVEIAITNDGFVSVQEKS